MIKKFLVLIAFTFAIWLILSGSHFYEPPNFFPLDNENAEYDLTKKCPKGQGWNEEGVAEGKVYCIEYKGTRVLSENKTDEIGFFRITVGHTELNLEKVRGHRIKSIKGKFSVSNKQCIQQKCISLEGQQTVLDIGEIEFYD